MRALTARALARARAAATSLAPAGGCAAASSRFRIGFVDLGRDGAEGQAGRLQHAPAKGRGRSEDELTHPRSRSARTGLTSCAIVQQADDGGRGLLDGAARHVDDRPAVAGAQAARVGDLVGDLRAIDVVVEVAVGHQAHAVAADLGDALGARHQADDEGRVRLGQRRRQLDAGHQRQVGGLVAALGEIDAGRRLGGARDAENDDVGGVEVLRQLAVVVGHGEVERVDAAEVVGIDDVLAGHDRRLRRAEVGFEHLHDRLQHVQRRHLELAAALLDLLDQLLVDDGVEDDAGRLLDLLQHALELLGGAHQRMHVLDRPHLRVLHGGGLGHGGERLAGRIRDEVQMEVAGQPVGHLLKRPEFARAAKPRLPNLQPWVCSYQQNGAQVGRPGQRFERRSRRPR